jgi:hypothetical protein
MTLSVALHSPTTAHVVDFTMDGKSLACLHLSDFHGRSIQVFAEPAVAHAMAEAFNEARRKLAAEAQAEAFEDDVWLTPAEIVADMK